MILKFHWGCGGGSQPCPLVVCHAPKFILNLVTSSMIALMEYCLFTGFATKFLMPTTKQQLVWTLRWRGLTSWASPSICRCECWHLDCAVQDVVSDNTYPHSFNHNVSMACTGGVAIRSPFVHVWSFYERDWEMVNNLKSGAAMSWPTGLLQSLPILMYPCIIILVSVPAWRQISRNWSSQES